MSGLEFNKFAAGVLVAGIMTIGIGKLAGVLYHPETDPETRGFKVDVAEAAEGNAAAQPAAEKPEDILPLLATADAAKGQVLAKKCAACHSFDQGGPNKVGPNLWGVVGQDIAVHAGFAYSDALTGLPGNWDYVSLSEFIKSPKNYAAGTKMAFAGLRDLNDRANLLAYLRSLSASPMPLPEVPAVVETPAPDAAAPTAEGQSADAPLEGAPGDTATPEAPTGEAPAAAPAE